MPQLKLCGRALGMIPLVALAVGLAPAGQDAPPTEAERAELRKGHVVLKEIPSPGKKGRTFQALGILPCGLDEAFAVLTDFGRYHEFMPQVQRAEARPDGPGAAASASSPASASDPASEPFPEEEAAPPAPPAPAASERELELERMLQMI